MSAMKKIDRDGVMMLEGREVAKRLSESVRQQTEVALPEWAEWVCNNVATAAIGLLVVGAAAGFALGWIAGRVV